VATVYNISWKGDIHKSVVCDKYRSPFFDNARLDFRQKQKQNTVHLSEYNKAAGYLELENARVRWFLSLDYNDIPKTVKESGKRTYRSIK